MLRIAGVRRAVVVAPHPDDEIIGAAALIQRLVRQRTQMSVVIVSDGAASHGASLRWPRDRLVKARRRESLFALRRLGVTTGQVTFLGFPDAGLQHHLSSCRRALRRVTAVRGVADLIVGPAAGDGHPDHRVVAAALSALPGRMRRLTYQVWPPRVASATRGRAIMMRGGHMAKRSLIRMHRTQTGIIHDDPGGFAIAAHELTAFSHPREIFVEQAR